MPGKFDLKSFEVCVLSALFVCLFSVRLTAVSDNEKSETASDKAGFAYLSDIEPSLSMIGFSVLGRDCRYTGEGEKQPLKVKGYKYKKGLGAHPPASVKYNLDGQYDRFKSLAAINDTGRGAVVFSVFGDGKELYRSKPILKIGGPQKIDISIAGVKELELRVEDSGDGLAGDHAVWCDALVLKKGCAGPLSSRSEKKEDSRILKQKPLRLFEMKGSPYEYKFPLPKDDAGYALAVKNYLDDLDPSVPPPKGGNNVLSTFATPGEYEPATFVIYAQKDLNDIKIVPTELKSDGNVISKDNISVRTVLRTPERIFYDSAPYKCKVTNRFLPEYKSLSLKRGEFREIWLTFKVPDKTAPGLYKGKVDIVPENGLARSLNIELEVLPFKLQDNPDKMFGVYYRGEHNDPKRMLLEFKDIKEHGGRIIRWSHCDVNYYVKGGEIQWDFSTIRRFLDLKTEAGIKGPVIINTKFDILASLLGHKNNKGFAEVATEIKKDEKFFEASKQVLLDLKKIQEEYPGSDFILTHMDEVFNKGRLPLYIALSEAVRRSSDFKMYSTFHTSGDNAEKMRMEIDPYVDVRCHHGASFECWLANGHSMAEYKSELKKSKDQAWQYHNLTGTRMTPEFQRIINGLYAWQNPFSGRIDWIYYQFMRKGWQRNPKVNPFMVDAEGGHWFGYSAPSPDDHATPVPTRCWEAWREGVDDLKYIYTLEKLIERYHLEDRHDEVEDAEIWLEELAKKLPKSQNLEMPARRAHIVPEGVPLTYAISESLTSEDYQNIRRKTAEHIRKLNADLKK